MAGGIGGTSALDHHMGPAKGAPSALSLSQWLDIGLIAYNDGESPYDSDNLYWFGVCWFNSLGLFTEGSGVSLGIADRRKSLADIWSNVRFVGRHTDVVDRGCFKSEDNSEIAGFCAGTKVSAATCKPRRGKRWKRVGRN